MRLEASMQHHAPGFDDRPEGAPGLGDGPALSVAQHGEYMHRDHRRVYADQGVSAHSVG